ncbi:MAG: DNA polymerase/3'-5' exonuclease PolX [Candidatus Helarchaeota archaeon]
MRNQEIADILYEIADILEIQGEIQWKVLAYRRAARTLESLSEDIAEIIGTKKLAGIGKAIEDKIEELLTTGKMEYYEAIKKKIPPIIIEMTRIPDVGPKTAKLIYDSLKIQSISDLEKAAKSHRLLRIKGLGPKTEKAILKGLTDLKKPQRHLLGMILPIANRIYRALKDLKEINQISLAGSIRRRKETIRDIDILVTSNKPEKVMQVFTTLDIVKKVSLKGPTKSTILVRKDIQVDLRVVENESYGAALQYFTGSKEHNVTLRTMCSQRGYKLNEYGLFSKESDEKLAGITEKEIYNKLGMAWIPPELREDRGEIEAALNDTLPKLIELGEVRGDLHIHTNYSDGESPIEAIVEAAKKRRYEYIGITDHAGNLPIAKAIDEKKLLAQIDQIQKINDKQTDVHIIAGAEVNIDLEGNLDISDAVLDQLNLVIGAIHSKLRMPRSEITERLVRALSNKHLTILAHPTGRILNKRPGADLDLKKIFATAKKYGKILEINAYPNRLDLSDVNSRAAKNQGILLAIGTDAHSARQLHFMEYGVAVARRGWLESKDILNTFSLKDLQLKLKIK